MLLRIEKKYLVPNYKMDSLRKRIAPFVRADKFTSPNEKGEPEYTVRSIYFDSRQLACYSEKHEGVMLRRKFRIRGYNTVSENSRVVMEIKRKVQERQKKYRSPVIFKNIEKLLDSGDLESYLLAEGDRKQSLIDAGKFMYHIKKGQFIPTCYVAYEREAYHGKFDEGVRITLDKNIRSRLYPKINSLYDDEMTKLLFKKHFILEIKYFSLTMPLWARSVVQEFRIRNDAISKYTTGIDVHRERVLHTY